MLKARPAGTGDKNTSLISRRRYHQEQAYLNYKVFNTNGLAMAIEFDSPDEDDNLS
jgi:hypothetical protein